MPHKLGWLVEDYGAVGDGATNDQPAFTGLIGGMATRTPDTKRQVCYLRPRTYAVNAPVVIDRSGICLEGQDPVGSVIRGSTALGATQPVIDVVANAGNTAIRDFELNCLTVTRINPGPLVRLRGCTVVTLAGLILANGNPYVTIDKPGTAGNTHIVLNHLDCSGGQATVGVDAADVNALRVLHSRLSLAGSGSIAVRLNTGAWPVVQNVGAINFSTYWYLRNVSGLATMVGGWRDSAVFTRWIDSDSGSRGVVFGRRITANPPAGTWRGYGPLDN